MKRTEVILLVLVALLLLAAGLAPPIAQDPAYHRFADMRSLLGIPNAMDSLSNLAFVGLGVWGIALLWKGQRRFELAAQNVFAAMFFAGFIATGLGSGWYHLAPDDAGLAWDRGGMVIAFAGTLGMMAAQRVSARAGWGLGVLALVLGPVSVAWWTGTQNLTPYAVMQFGGMGLLVWMLFLRSEIRGPNWGAFIAAYALAKVCEMFDGQIFALTLQTVSGHTLKHLLAACAALAVIQPLRSRGLTQYRYQGIST